MSNWMRDAAIDINTRWHTWRGDRPTHDEIEAIIYRHCMVALWEIRRGIWKVSDKITDMIGGSDAQRTDTERMARDIVSEIFNNLLGRSGIGNELESYSEKIREEIRHSLEKIVREAIDAAMQKDKE